LTTFRIGIVSVAVQGPNIQCKRCTFK
jgi:hypothetical protein